MPVNNFSREYHSIICISLKNFILSLYLLQTVLCLSVQTHKYILKFIWGGKGPILFKAILNKSKTEELNYLITNNYYKFSIINTLYYWHTDKLMDQWKRIYNPEKYPLM